MDIVVLVRCSQCEHVRKQWDKRFWVRNREIAFIPSTLKEYAEMTCERCSKQGMEIAVADVAQEEQGA
jgi:hypothetical protein